MNMHIVGGSFKGRLMGPSMASPYKSCILLELELSCAFSSHEIHY